MADITDIIDQLKRKLSKYKKRLTLYNGKNKILSDSIHSIEQQINDLNPSINTSYGI